jgi:hypothetical protein
MPRAKKVIQVPPQLTGAELAIYNIANIRSRFSCSVSEALDIYRELKAEAKEADEAHKANMAPVT